MKNLIAWFLGLTKIGLVAKGVQNAVDGKKTMIASLVTAITGTATIVIKFGDGGTPYLLGVSSTPEFIAASGGWIAFFNALKGEKIRHENAQILDQLNKK